VGLPGLTSSALSLSPPHLLVPRHLVPVSPCRPPWLTRVDAVGVVGRDVAFDEAGVRPGGVFMSTEGPWWAVTWHAHVDGGAVVGVA
jgi:hypothetical protein